MECDVIWLQNTRLAKQQLSQLADINSQFDVIGAASVDFAHGLLKARPYGGTAIFWSNSLSVHPIKDVDETRIEILLDTENGKIKVINVLMPWCSKTNTDLYFQYLSKLDSICESLNSSKICIVGDYNASPANAFRKLLEVFCNGKGFCIADVA